MKYDKKLVLNMLGTFLILVFIYNLINQFFAGEQFEIFWLCNHVPLIVGIGILLRKQSLIAAEFCLLFFASFVWIIDLFFLFTTGASVIGDIAFFWDQNIFYQISTVTIHLSFIPVTLLAIFLIGKKIKGALLISYIHWGFLLIIAYLFRERNFNCVIDSCIKFIPTFKLHFLMVIIVYSFAIFLVSIFLNKYLRR